VSVFVESNIEFDFTNARSAFEYEKVLNSLPGASAARRNKFWPGIDFHIDDTANSSIWLEVKNWDPANISAVRIGGSRWSYTCKMKSDKFAAEMRNKFLGATSFFAWDSRAIPNNVHFLLLFEPPHPMDSALVLTLGHKVKQQLMPPRVLPWRQRITVGALTLAEWNLRFPDYPAAKI